MHQRPPRPATSKGPSPSATSSTMTSKLSPSPDTRPGPPPSSGIRESIASCSRATRYSSAGAVGGPRWLDGVSDRERYIESLELIRTLDFDLIVPGIAPAGELYYQFVEKAEA